MKRSKSFPKIEMEAQKSLSPLCNADPTGSDPFLQFEPARQRMSASIKIDNMLLLIKLEAIDEEATGGRSLKTSAVQFLSPFFVVSMHALVILLLRRASSARNCICSTDLLSSHRCAQRPGFSPGSLSCHLQFKQV